MIERSAMSKDAIMAEIPPGVERKERERGVTDLSVIGRVAY